MVRHGVARPNIKALALVFVWFYHDTSTHHRYATQTSESNTDFCLAACNEDAGFAFQLIFSNCNASSVPGENASFVFSPENIQCKCKLGMRVSSSDPSRCEYCPKKQYMNVEEYSFEC